MRGELRRPASSSLGEPDSSLQMKRKSSDLTWGHFQVYCYIVYFGFRLVLFFITKLWSGILKVNSVLVDCSAMSSMTSTSDFLNHCWG